MATGFRRGAPLVIAAPPVAVAFRWADPSLSPVRVLTSRALHSLPPEAQLLFETASDTPHDAAIETLLAGPLDWSSVALLAHREQALTVFWQRLSRFGSLVPSAQGAQFAQLAQVAEFHLAHLQHRFEQSVMALAKESIEVVLLKGAGLAYTAYPSFSARPMSDVDLLLHPGQGAAAQSVLGRMGWDWARTEESQQFYARHHHLPPLFDTRGGGANLELHTELFIAEHPLGLTADAVWAAARPVQVSGVTTYVPHPHHQMLHACLHFAWGHMMQSGAWRTFRDVDAIVKTGEVDWDEFVRLAEQTRGASCCYWTFDLAKMLGGVTTIPEAVLLRLRPPLSRLVRERLRRHLAMMVLGPVSASPSVMLNRLVWRAAVMPEHSGHGEVRPWAQEDRLVAKAHAGTRDPLGKRLVARAAKIGVYTRYVRLMLTR